MALKTLQKIYEGADLNAPVSGVMYFRIEEACTIKDVLIYADSPVSADATFNCKLNGTDLFSGAGRPKISAGEESGFVTGLSIAALKGDKFVLSLESLSGTLDAPVTLLLTVDDGASSGGGSSNGYSKFDVDAPYLSPSAFDDDFDGSALNSRWMQRGSPTITPNDPPSHISLLAGDGGFNGIYQPITANAPNIFRVKTYLNPVIGENFGIYGGLGSPPNEFYGFGIQTAGSYPNPSIELRAASFFPRSGSYSTFGSATHSYDNFIIGAAGVYYFEIEFTSSLIMLRYSRDGISFIPFTTLSNYGFTSVCIGGSNQSGKTLIDWFRKVDSTGRTGRLITL